MNGSWVKDMAITVGTVLTMIGLAVVGLAVIVRVTVIVWP